VRNVGRSVLKPILSDDAIAFVPTSVVLQRLYEEAPSGHFTLDWLLERLRGRSFGIVILLLALGTLAPGISIVAGVMLMIPAFQMIFGQPAPIFPRRIGAHPFQTSYLTAVVQRALPVLKFLEKMIHPRWRTPLGATKRLVGAVVMILNITVVFSPIPLSNIVPGLVILLISLAYLEEDGLLLSIALLAAFIVLLVAAAAIWQTVSGAIWIIGLW
jgi:hypothetical protein